MKKTRTTLLAIMMKEPITLPSKSTPRVLQKKREDAAFSEIVQLIAVSREDALQAVNTALIDLYWQVGATISRKIAAAEWGDGVVEELAAYIARTEPGLRGFTRANLFRMRQFYDTYNGDEKVAPLVRQLPWSHHLIILGQSKRPGYPRRIADLPVQFAIDILEKCGSLEFFAAHLAVLIATISAVAIRTEGPIFGQLVFPCIPTCFMPLA